MRDNMLDYFRALTGRYREMGLMEKVCLCELIMYEAMKRFVAGANNEQKAKYRMIVTMAETQENMEAEVGFFEDLYKPSVSSDSSGLIVV